jgi:hypothetical protein
MSGTDESRRSNPYLLPRDGYVQFPVLFRVRETYPGGDAQAATFAGAVFRSQYSPITGSTSGMNR